ncbi:MAG: hypothetical protein AB7F43_06350 [Bacteriovoracia bacterium]
MARRSGSHSMGRSISLVLIFSLCLESFSPLIASSAFAQTSIQPSLQQNSGLVGVATQQQMNSTFGTGELDMNTEMAQLLNDPFASTELQQCTTQNIINESNAMLAGAVADIANKYSGGTGLNNLAGAACDADIKIPDVPDSTKLCSAEEKDDEDDDEDSLFSTAKSVLEDGLSSGSSNLTAKEAREKRKQEDKRAVRIQKAKLYEVTKNQIAKEKSKAACKTSKLSNAGMLVDCSDRQLKALKNTVSAMRDLFKQKIDEQNKYEQFINDKIQEEQDRIEAIAKKHESMKAAAAGIEGALKQFAEDKTLSRIDKLVNDQVQFLKTFERRKNDTIAQYTQQCLFGAGAVNSQLPKCLNADGTFMTPYKCIWSRFQRKRADDLTNNARDKSNADIKKSVVATNTFTSKIASYLRQYVNNTNRDAALNKIRGLGAEGNDLATEMVSCEKESRDQVESDVSNGAGSIGQEIATLKQTATEVVGNAEPIVEEFGSKIRTGIFEFFGNQANSSFNPDACLVSVSEENSVTAQAESVKKMRDCVKNLRTVANQILYGSGKAATTAPGSSGETITKVSDVPGKPIFCRSLTECISESSRARTSSEQLIGKMKGSGTFKIEGSDCPASGCSGLQRFKANLKRNSSEKFDLAARLLKNRVEGAKFSINSFRNSLSKLGVKISFKDPKKIRSFQLREDGSLPEDFEDLMLAQAGVPELGDTDEAKEKISEQQKIVAGKDGELDAALKRLEANYESCKRNTKKEVKQERKRERTERDADLRQRGQDISQRIQRLLDRCSLFVSERGSMLCQTSLPDIEADLNDICEADASSSACSNARIDLLELKQMCETPENCPKVYSNGGPLDTRLLNFIQQNGERGNTPGN